MKKLITMGITLLFCSCATIVNGSRQQVFFKGANPDKKIKVVTPDGTYDVEGGSGSYMMTRSKSDISVGIVCPNGAKRSHIMTTSWSWEWGIFGNLFLFPVIGWIIDPFTDRAYHINDLSLNDYCK